MDRARKLCSYSILSSRIDTSMEDCEPSASLHQQFSIRGRSYFLSHTSEVDMYILVPMSHGPCVLNKKLPFIDIIDLWKKALEELLLDLEMTQKFLSGKEKAENFSQSRPTDCRKAYVEMNARTMLLSTTTQSNKLSHNILPNCRYSLQIVKQSKTIPIASFSAGRGKQSTFPFV